jgi:hypothetical protein
MNTDANIQQRRSNQNDQNQPENTLPNTSFLTQTVASSVGNYVSSCFGNIISNLNINISFKKGINHRKTKSPTSTEHLLSH